ncbi:MAG TPA: hypothetical protein VJZ93_01800 [Candidatus Nanoarchaeia archaeon]|nr:hypothetical protein [Candidatus Nanoarchaeia archaeon]
MIKLKIFECFGSVQTLSIMFNNFFITLKNVKIISTNSYSQDEHHYLFVVYEEND